jgi:hypothetical protein
MVLGSRLARFILNLIEESTSWASDLSHQFRKLRMAMTRRPIVAALCSGFSMIIRRAMVIAEQSADSALIRACNAAKSDL